MLPAVLFPRGGLMLVLAQELVNRKHPLAPAPLLAPEQEVRELRAFPLHSPCRYPVRTSSPASIARPAHRDLEAAPSSMRVER